MSDRVVWVATALFFCSLFAVLLQTVMHKRLNHDENMYVANGALLVRGWWPYADYPSFQMPLLSLVYGGAFLMAGDMLLAARLINTLFALGCCLLVVVLVRRVLPRTPAFVWAGVASGGVLIYVSNAPFVYTVGRAWNHDVPLLLTLGGLVVFTSRSGARGARVPLASAGLLLGLATSARLLFVVATVPFVVALLLASSASRARRVAWFAMGFLLGLTPSAPFALKAPARFWFDNVTYHGLNEQYWHAQGYERAMTLTGKFVYTREVLLGAAANWTVLLGVALVIALVVRQCSRRGRETVALTLGAAASLFVAGLVPTPTWLQYFYAPYGLLAVSFVTGTAVVLRTAMWKAALALFIGVTALSVWSGAQAYAALGHVRHLDDWTSAMVARVSREVRTAVPRGTVVTLAPIYALEAGLDIYPGLASGPFGYRVSELIEPRRRRAQGLISAEDTIRLMAESPPEAILAGAEDEMEAPLVAFAAAHGYAEQKLSNGLSLWVRP